MSTIMTDERLLVVRAVWAGQLPAGVLTDSEIVEMQETVMDRLMNKLYETNPCVFWGEDSPSVH